MTENTEKSIESHFRDWEGEVFGFGYGTGEKYTLGALKAFLGAIGKPGLDHAYDYRVLEVAVGPVACWLLISTLCHADIIEYGTSPRGGWLTPEGIALRDFVRSKTVDELVDIVCGGEEEDIIRCAPTYCNCGPNGYSKVKLCKNPFWPNGSD